MSTVTLLENGEKTELSFTDGCDLLTLLRQNGFAPDAPCGGSGTCGKCRVLLRENGEERAVLACRTTLTRDCTVRLPDRGAAPSWNDPRGSVAAEPGRTGLGAAVDLGTTTVALRLYDLASGVCLGTESAWNAQRGFGADVISRISCCIESPDGLSALSRAIRSQIMELLRTLCRKSGCGFSALREIVLAGNTVMQHLFVGLDPSPIASAPFTPRSYFDGGAPASLDGVPVFLSPCVSGYVGGDITAGLLGVALHRRSGTALFLDVGTNGEMALGGADGFLTCAVASGPAFEGAGITCGMPAVHGAIHRVVLDGDELCFDVLGGGEAEGICGSGLLDLAACLLELGLIDGSGRLMEDENGEAVFRLTERVWVDQRDIRQLQLAKAAVAAGIRRLLQEAKLSCGAVGALYLAGGFGNRLRPESAVRIGLLPRELLGRVVPCGNSSLAGAQTALLRPSERAALRDIRSACRYLELSSDPAFNDYFIEELSFPEEEP